MEDPLVRKFQRLTPAMALADVRVALGAPTTESVAADGRMLWWYVYGPQGFVTWRLAFDRASGLTEVELGGAAGLDRAEVARARADVAQDHHGGGAARPALAEIGALRALADGVELVLIHQPAGGGVAGSGRQLGAEPGRFARGIHQVSGNHKHGLSSGARFF